MTDLENGAYRRAKAALALLRGSRGDALRCWQAGDVRWFWAHHGAALWWWDAYLTRRTAARRTRGTHAALRPIPECYLRRATS